MMIYTVQRSKKTRKQKVREKAAWEKQQSQYHVLATPKFVPMRELPRVAIRADGEAYKQVASVKTAAIHTFKSEPMQYTGTEIIGIATMHKSNLVPVTSAEAAKDIARMRRS